MSELHAEGMPPSDHEDWVLDLKPGSGVNGGEIVAEGTPEQVTAVPQSFTGAYLMPLLEWIGVAAKSPSKRGSGSSTRLRESA